MNESDKDFEAFLDGKHALNAEYRRASDDASEPVPMDRKRSIHQAAAASVQGKNLAYYLSRFFTGVRRHPGLTGALLVLVIAVPLVPRPVDETLPGDALESARAPVVARLKTQTPAMERAEDSYAQLSSPAPAEPDAIAAENQLLKMGKAQHGKQAMEAASAADNPAAPHSWSGYRRLNSEQILAAYANVRDDAQVQDGQGGSAVNHWYADGRFTSEWQSPAGRGKLTGSWYVKDNLRCLTIKTGMPELEGKERCGPVYTKDSLYYSSNKAGSIHGIHTLSPLSVN